MMGEGSVLSFKEKGMASISLEGDADLQKSLCSILMKASCELQLCLPNNSTDVQGVDIKEQVVFVNFHCSDGAVTGV